MAAFAPCVAFTLAQEGGFVDNPSDPGGPTNFGITLSTLTRWRGKPTGVQDVRDLTADEAQAIYGALYWNPVRGDDLPAGLDLMVFDFGVTAGPRQSAITLQRAVNVTQDGYIGPVTLAALKQASPFALIALLAEWQAAYYGGCGNFSTFGRGWLNRTEARRQTATAMLNSPATQEASQ